MFGPGLNPHSGEREETFFGGKPFTSNTRRGRCTIADKGSGAWNSISSQFYESSLEDKFRISIVDGHFSLAIEVPTQNSRDFGTQFLTDLF